MSENITITVTLPKETVEKIKMIADANGTTLANTVIESVNLNAIISEGERNRARIILQNPDGRAIEIERIRPRT